MYIGSGYDWSTKGLDVPRDFPTPAWHPLSPTRKSYIRIVTTDLLRKNVDRVFHVYIYICIHRYNAFLLLSANAACAAAPSSHFPPCVRCSLRIRIIIIPKAQYEWTKRGGKLWCTLILFPFIFFLSIIFFFFFTFNHLDALTKKWLTEGLNYFLLLFVMICNFFFPLYKVCRLMKTRQINLSFFFFASS